VTDHNQGAEDAGHEYLSAEYQDDNGTDDGAEHQLANIVNNGSVESHYIGRIHRGTKLRLAHFSVKEYLQSSRVAESSAKAYHLKPGQDHRFLAQSCLVYLIHYSKSTRGRGEDRPEKRRILKSLPLLEYAAKRWWSHAAQQMPGDTRREIRFLLNDTYLKNCLEIYAPDDPYGANRFIGKEHSGEGLCFASLANLQEVVREMIATGADIDRQSDSERTALRAAASQGHVAMVRLLLDSKADVNAGSGRVGPLWAAIAADSEEVVRMLLDVGADVEAEHVHDYRTALQAAAAIGRETIVRMVLDAKAARKNSDLRAASTIIAGDEDGGSQTTTSQVETDTDLNEALRLAAEHEHEKVVRLILAAGADVNVCDLSGHGMTALQEASGAGATMIVKVLLDAGATVNTCDRDGDSSLHKASREGQSETVEILLHAGASPTLINSFGNNALMYALGCGHKEVARLLWNVTTDVSEEVMYRKALLMALESGNKKVVKRLLDDGAEVNDPATGFRSNKADEISDLRRDIDHHLPLHAAVENGDPDIVRMILDAGVDINAWESDGESALQLALRKRGYWAVPYPQITHQYKGIIRLLLDAGADSKTDGIEQIYSFG
jgi:ankyrin repeat protein